MLQEILPDIDKIEIDAYINKSIPQLKQDIQVIDSSQTEQLYCVLSNVSDVLDLTNLKDSRDIDVISIPQLKAQRVFSETEDAFKHNPRNDNEWFYIHKVEYKKAIQLRDGEKWLIPYNLMYEKYMIDYIARATVYKVSIKTENEKGPVETVDYVVVVGKANRLLFRDDLLLTSGNWYISIRDQKVIKSQNLSNDELRMLLDNN